MSSSLYIHIPFCHHLCSYCDFSKLLFKESWASSYLEALFNEIKGYNINKPLKTIYIGGGTPTSLNKEQLEKLLYFLSPYKNEDTEFTIEANPEDLKEDKLLLLKDKGINRLSIGVESSKTKFLRLMERNHTFLEAYEGIKLAKKIGFKRISADFIYALPSETLEEAIEEVKAFLTLDLTHLSAYCLSINPMTKFHNLGYKELDEEEAGLQYEAICRILEEGGFKRYEISNFAKNNDVSRHNLVYWRDEEYYGAGLGASGYINKVRYQNTKNLRTYLKGNYCASKEIINQREELKEFFLTNLRLVEGFSLTTFEKRFGFPFIKKYESSFNKLSKNGLLKIENNRLLATNRGLELLDQILLELF